MASTSPDGLRFPAGGDEPAVPLWLERLASDTQAALMAVRAGVIVPGAALHRGFIPAGPIGAVAANSIYAWRVLLPGSPRPIIYQAFAAWRFWSQPNMGYTPNSGAIRAATAQVSFADSAPGELVVTAHFPQAGTPDNRAGAFEGINWMCWTET